MAYFQSAYFQSNVDAILVAAPMIVVMFAGFFRLDELLSRPAKDAPAGRQFSTWDGKGEPVCVEPDGRKHRSSGRPVRSGR